jgi:hypothetical protein
MSFRTVYILISNFIVFAVLFTEVLPPGAVSGLRMLLCRPPLREHRPYMSFVRIPYHLINYM